MKTQELRKIIKEEIKKEYPRWNIDTELGYFIMLDVDHEEMVDMMFNMIDKKPSITLMEFITKIYNEREADFPINMPLY